MGGLFFVGQRDGAPLFHAGPAPSVSRQLWNKPSRMLLYTNLLSPWPAAAIRSRLVKYTVAVMKMALDDAWNHLRPEAQAAVLKTTLAVCILESASQGQRDCRRLRDAALRGLAA